MFFWTAKDLKVRDCCIYPVDGYETFEHIEVLSVGSDFLLHIYTRLTWDYTWKTQVECHSKININSKLIHSDRISGEVMSLLR